MASRDLTERHLTDEIKTLVRKGNARRIVVRNSLGDQVVAMPVTVGLVAVVAAPVVSAVGALAALTNRWTIAVEPADPPSLDEERRS